MFNFFLIYRFAQARQREILEEAQQEQLAREAKRLAQARPRSRPSLWQQWTWALGDAMIAWGQRLQGSEDDR
jgi:hypothetical protein